tara:strand:- start:506 stop:1828 length:1323 start_codon:yes stop_codon:yes gene_type:complete
MKKYIFIVIVILSFESLLAQNIHTGFHSQAFILKSSSNASAFPESNIILGFPALSNLNLGFQSPFSLNEVLKKGADDSLRVNFPSLVKHLKTGRGIYMQAREQLFFVGLKLGSNKSIFAYMGDEIISSSGFVLSGEFLDYLTQGNAHFLNQQMNFNSEKFESILYNSFYFGASFKPLDKLTLGTRFKILHGLVNVNTEVINLSVYTDSLSIPVYLTNIDANVMIRTSGQGIARDSLSFDPLLNNGFAFDFGITYDATDKLEISLAINDIGKINWAKENNLNYATDGQVDYVIDGLVMSSSGNNDFENQIEEIVDSISNIFSLSETSSDYSTKLKSNLFFGAKYELNEQNSFSFLFHSRNQISSRFNLISLGYQLQASKSLELLASYQNLNGVSNIATGFVLSPGSVQMHLIIDNTLAADVFDAKNFAFQFGITFGFGKPK